MKNSILNGVLLGILGLGLGACGTVADLSKSACNSIEEITCINAACELSSSMSACMGSAGSTATVGEDVHFGFRNGVNMSANGVINKCQARLHPCFKDGIYDSAIIFVESQPEPVAACAFACELSNEFSVSQIACNEADCNSRCLAWQGVTTDCT